MRHFACDLLLSSGMQGGAMQSTMNCNDGRVLRIVLDRFARHLRQLGERAKEGATHSLRPSKP